MEHRKLWHSKILKKSNTLGGEQHLQCTCEKAHIILTNNINIWPQALDIMIDNPVCWAGS